MSPEVRADLTLDGSQAESAISALGDQLDAIFGGTQSIEIPVTADTSEAVGAIESLPSDIAPIDVPVTADTADAQTQIEDLGNTAVDTGGSLDSAGGKASSAGQEFQTAGAGADLMGSSMGTAVIGAAGLTFGLAEVIGATIATADAERRFNDEFGKGADNALKVAPPLNTLATNYKDLGASLGLTTAETLTALTTTDQFVKGLGFGGQRADDFRGEIVNMALAMHGARPDLGSVQADVTKLERAFVSGTSRGLVPFGISLNAAKIREQELRDAAVGANFGLDEQQQKTLAISILLEKQFGPAVQKHVVEGQKSAQTALDKTKNALIDFASTTIAPVALPALKGLADFVSSDAFTTIAPIVQRVGLDIATFGGAEVARNFPVILDFFKSLPGLVTTAASAVGGFFSNLGSTIAGGLGQALGNIGGFFQNIVGTIQGHVQTAIGFIRGLIGAIAGIPSKAVDIAVNGVEAAIGLVGSLISTIGSLVGKVVDVGVSGVEHATDLVSTLTGGIVNLNGKIVPVGVVGAESAVASVKEVGAAIGGLPNTKDIFINVSSNVAAAVAGVGAAISSLGKAEGGHITAAMAGADVGKVGGTYLVGEVGPELFVPDVPGTIIPNNQLSGLLGNAEPSVVKIHEQPQIHILVVRDWADAQAQIPGLERADPSFVMGRH